MRVLKVALLVFSLAILIAAGACGDNEEGKVSSPAAGGGQGGADRFTVNVIEQDFSISLDSNSVAQGEVTFNIQNQGPTTHEFVVIRTDLDQSRLPVEGGEVNEDAPGLDVVDEVEDLEPGQKEALTVDLARGRYVLICNISGHYQSGMHAAFTVR